MPKSLKYVIDINNCFTEKTTTYEIPKGDLHDVVDIINRHFGCVFTSTSGVNNYISRGIDKSPQRMGCITIHRINKF